MKFGVYCDVKAEESEVRQKVNFDRGVEVVAFFRGRWRCSGNNNDDGFLIYIIVTFVLAVIVLSMI